MRLSPVDPRLHVFQATIARAHLNAGRYTEASLWAERALHNKPNDGNALRVLAASSAHAGHMEKARQAIARYLQLAPDWSLTEVKNWDSPYRRPDDYAKLVDGLRKAGLAEQQGFA